MAFKEKMQVHGGREGNQRWRLDWIYLSVYVFSMDSRSALLRSALMLFAQRGYDGVGVQEIVVLTGVTKPTLYHFFGSKLGLLQALFQEYATELDRNLAEASVYKGDLPATLDRIAAAYIDFATAQPLAYRLELALYFAPRENPARTVAVGHYAHRQTILEGVFVAATRDHGNMKGRHQRYAVSLVGVLNSYIALQLDGEITITDRLRWDLVHQFSHGIYS
jgi:TetR/AcrR family transcriptional regulator